MNLKVKQFLYGVNIQTQFRRHTRSASEKVVKALLSKGAYVKAYNPMTSENFSKTLQHDRLFLYPNAMEAIKNSSALCILTEWGEFSKINLPIMKVLMRTPIILDGRNIYLKTI